MLKEEAHLRRAPGGYCPLAGEQECISKSGYIVKASVQITGFGQPVERPDARASAAAD